MAETAASKDVIINFIVNDADLQDTVDKIEDLGTADKDAANKFKTTNAELNKQIQLLQKMVGGANQLNDRYKNLLKNMVSGGVRDALKEAGVSAKQFATELQKLGVPLEQVETMLGEIGQESDQLGAKQETLKQKLRAVTNELAALDAAGQRDSARYKELVTLAGQYGDSIDEVNVRLRNARDGERTINSLVNAGQQLTQSFAGVAAASALVAGENEEMQKTFAKLGLIMQATAGIQAIVTGLQTDGAITLAIYNVQEKIKGAQLAINNALESKSIVIRGAATVAQKALNVAIAANPIGLLITALATVIPLMLLYSQHTRKAAAEQASLNAAVDATEKNLQAEIDGLNRANDEIIAGLEANSTRQSEILQQNLNTEFAAQEARVRQWEDNQRKINAVQDKRSDEYVKLLETQFKLEQEIDQANTEGRIRNIELLAQKRKEALEDQVSLDNAALSRVAEGSRAQLNLQLKLIRDQRALELQEAGNNAAKRQEIIAKSIRDEREMRAAFRQRELAADIQANETRLVNVQDDLMQEFTLRSRLLELNLQKELANVDLSEKEKKQLRDRAFQEQIALQREFDRKITEQAIASEQSRLQAELQRRNISDEERLNAQIASLELAAAAEVVAAEGNAVKIKEIYAKRDAAIRDFKKQMILEQAEYEIQMENARTGEFRRAQERILKNEFSTFGQRRAAIQELAALEVDEIDTRIRANEELYQKKLISDKEYNLQFEKLLDQRKAAVERNDEEIRRITLENIRKIAEFTVNIAATIVSGIQAIGQEYENNARIFIDTQKKQVDALLEAGAITEKDAEERRKRIDQQERRLQFESAKRNKQLAVFQALINVAQGVTAALSTPPPYSFILAGIVAALGAVQVAAISARPLPKFAKGKKDNWSGWGEVGEAGGELVETRDGMYYAKNRTIVYLRPEDKVYTAAESKRMMMPKTVRGDQMVNVTNKGTEIDYDKLGNVIASKQKQGPTINIHKDYISESVTEGLGNYFYRTNRYKF